MQMFLNSGNSTRLVAKAGNSAAGWSEMDPFRSVETRLTEHRAKSVAQARASEPTCF